MIRVIQKPVHDNNWRKGSIPRAVRAVGLHIAEGNEEAVDSWFNDPRAVVSAHFLVGHDGELRQYVSIHDIAYHAGQAVRPTWPGFVFNNTNATTIGIEHEGHPQMVWTQAMMQTSTLLSAWLVNRFGPVTGLKADELHFFKHSEVKATKPFCPGDHLDRPLYLERVRWWLQNFQGDELHNMIQGIR